MRTILSIIIPAFNARTVLPKALASIAKQDSFLRYPDVSLNHARYPLILPRQVEVVIAADDHEDYSFAASYLPPDMAVVLIPPSARGTATGPGATRNRAIAGSSGEFLAFLDADDTWSKGYLLALLPLAQRHGVSFGATAIIASNGETMLTLGVDGAGQGNDQRALSPQIQPPQITPSQITPALITPSYFGRWPGSFHPLVRRDLSNGFDDGAGQDVFHALEVLGAVGGYAPFQKQALYQLHLTSGSVTASPAFTRRIDQRYQDRLDRYRTHHSNLQGMARLRAMQAVSRRRYWNKLFSKKDRHSAGFYGFYRERRNNIF